MIDPVSRPSALYRFLYFATGPLVAGLFRLDVRGLDHVPQGGFVLAANHTSNLDPWPLGIPLYPRWLRFMAKSELYWWPLGPFLKSGGAFPVRRGTGDTEAIRTAVELVRDGEIVVMFPEGTRQRKGLRKKWTARPHTGAVRIAHDAAAPVLPAAIKGTDKLSQVAKLRVAYGEPFVPGPDATAETERLMADIQRLYDSL
jgi:1-acyl-sn-glycerol-3-phosphate acyltransferase